MSTYLLAFVISDFSVISNNKNDHSLYARSNAIQGGRSALEFEDKIFKKYEEYTTIPFGINKMDLIAVPKMGGKSKAMENWGAITFG